MNVNFKNVFKVVFTILGTIIGAGFATGKEIFLFFNVYGYKGLFGITFSMLFIGLIAYKTLNIVLTSNINAYNEFINRILGNKKVISSIMNSIINVFLLISFQIMFAAFGAYFLQELHVSQIYGILIIAILSYIILRKNVEGIIKVNEYFIPIMLVLIIALSIGNKGAFLDIEKNTTGGTITWIKSSILYASYNSIVLIPILISLKKYVSTKREVRIISILAEILLLFLGISIYRLLKNNFDIIKNIEMPLAHIANMVNVKYKYIYGISILVAIFTTVISTGYGFLVNCTKTNKQYNIVAAIICSVSIVISQIGFSNLLAIMYPMFGYLGIIQIIFLLIS